ncbi:ribonuclease H-like domain-containing protein [Mycena polygramma]|nr:ribonuclease H-like domain-containing protein [Mycena polygramma]
MESVRPDHTSVGGVHDGDQTQQPVELTHVWGAVLTAIRQEYPITHRVHYLSSASAVNDALRMIRDGVIGFDAEYMARTLSDVENMTEEIFSNIPGSKRSANIVWQVWQSRQRRGRQIAWDHVGLCMVQIARDDDVWLLNMNRIRAFPTELERVLASDSIVKVGVGIAADLSVVWNDLACNMSNVLDCGLMAKLLLHEDYKETPFTTMSLQHSVSAVLGFAISKDLQKSNWKGNKNGDFSEEQKKNVSAQNKNAAIDAHASLQLYHALVPALEQMGRDKRVLIPDAWYRFNGMYGYTVRKFQGYYP